MTVIAIVGCGIAGHEAALTARMTDLSARVKILTEEKHPLYSACVLADYVAGEIPRQRVLISRKQDYEEHRIELLLSQPVVDWFPDEGELQLNSGKLPYDKLVLATGSRPIIPKSPGMNKKGVFNFKTLKDAENIKRASGKSAVIVGTGPVGIEVAVSLRRKGWSVTLIELMGRVLPKVFDDPLADSLKKHLEAGGIQVFLEERLVEILGQKRVEAVQTDRRSIPADLVVLGLGMRPETELAKKGGLRLGPSGGILVDEGMNTSRPGVWACGDCVESMDRITGRKGLYMLWNNARLQERVAGANATDGERRYAGSFNLTTVNLFHDSAASVGVMAADLPDNEAQTFHQKGPRGELWLVLQNEQLVGVQALGRIERFGGLLGLLLRGENLREKLKEKPQSKGWQTWALRGVQRDLLRMLNT
ncbi:MAG: FAD-dependent oxidoreductase [Deltaproteobacteria bacterium]|nr:FAD-dependent oxidoreductase [Deltaproteobacteria bacterium]